MVFPFSVSTNVRCLGFTERFSVEYCFRSSALMVASEKRAHCFPSLENISSSVSGLIIT